MWFFSLEISKILVWGSLSCAILELVLPPVCSLDPSNILALPVGPAQRCPCSWGPHLQDVWSSNVTHWLWTPIGTGLLWHIPQRRNRAPHEKPLSRWYRLWAASGGMRCGSLCWSEGKALRLSWERPVERWTFSLVFSPLMFCSHATRVSRSWGV